MSEPRLGTAPFRESEVQPKDGEQGRKVYIGPCAFTWQRTNFDMSMLSIYTQMTSLELVTNGISMDFDHNRI